MIKMNDEAYFVHVKNPVDFRRNLLESSREIIHLMQDYQNLLDLRDKRLNKENAFKEELKEIILLVNSLEKRLPKKSLNKLKEALPEAFAQRREPKEAKTTKGKKGKKTKARKPARKDFLKTKQLTDVKRLEKALEAVEGKLHRL